MNPLTKVKAIEKLKKAEIDTGVEDSAGSWHSDYRDSAYIFVGGLDYGLTEGDLLAVFSQYGEIVSTNLVRDKATGKSKGFCFLAYEDQRSTILAVDNFNGIELCGRTIRVDHVKEYKAPKIKEGETRKEEGCAPRTPSPTANQTVEDERKAKKKAKKAKKLKKEERARSKLGLKTERTSIELEPSTISERARLLEEKYGFAQRSNSPEISHREARKSPPQKEKLGKSSEISHREASKSPPQKEKLGKSSEISHREARKRDDSPPQREKLGKSSEDKRRERKRKRTSSQERYHEMRSSDRVKGGRDRHRSRSRSQDRYKSSRKR